MIGSGSIGKYCSIGYFCQIGMHRHPIGYLSSSPVTYGRGNVLGIEQEWSDFPAPPEIGHDVWIGSSAQVLQGVRIGSGAVIGAGAVVTGDIPEYAVAVGIPARVARMRFDDETIEKLLRWNWWDLDGECLISFRHMFGNGRWMASDIPDRVGMRDAQPARADA
jgi:acetyltransferase-like isoleucine patch superfamily enzyme